MTWIQIISCFISLFISGYVLGKFREGLRWSKAHANRVVFSGDYYWVIPDADESAKRFVGTIFSTPHQWVDSTDYNAKRIPGHEAIATVSKVFRGEPSHRFVDTMGWQLGSNYWVTLSTFETGEYVLQLRQGESLRATAVVRSRCLSDAASWILHNTRNLETLGSSHYVYRPHPGY